MELYVGTSGYSYKEWKGIFYPPQLPQRGMLEYYAGHFRSVEINNTFYRMPQPSVLEEWGREVPPSFRFAIKAPQRITHLQRLLNAEEAVSHLLEVTALLRERLGPILFQLPPAMKKDVARLRDFLALLPTGKRFAFEFRHDSWLDREIFQLLADHHAALCISDMEAGAKAPFVATAGWGYLRLRRQDYTDADLNAWAKRVQEQSWVDAYVYFKHEDLAQGPLYAQTFLQLAGETPG